MSNKSIRITVLLSILVTALMLSFYANIVVSKPSKDTPSPQSLFKISEKQPGKGIVIVTYPQNRTLFPSELPAPEFLWSDSNTKADLWAVRVTIQGTNTVLSSATTVVSKWRPELQEWENIKKNSLKKNLKLEIISALKSNPNKILSEGSIIFRTSDDSCKFPIFYRDVDLPFNFSVKNPWDIKWRLGSISSMKQPPVILEKFNTCGNCHSFSKDGSILAMDFDFASDKGSYIITDLKKEILLLKSDTITWSNYRKRDGEQTFGLFSSISPDGRYVVSTVKDYSIFKGKTDLEYSQLFFPIKGILVLYDREKRTFSSLPGADDKKYVQSNPSWSPDGKYILFIRSKAIDVKVNPKTKKLVNNLIEKEFMEGGKQFKYDIYRVPFNNGKGGKSEPVKGASNNGMSNYFPKYSPDGKWIVFCKSENFCLLQPDSKLYIIPSEGGTASCLKGNTSRMNSWHSWSPNSRWLVFSSKQRGPFTKLYLTHINEKGISSPAVYLEKFVGHDRAANIPEFVSVKPDAIRKIYNHYIDDTDFLRIKKIPINNKNLTFEEKDFKRRISVNSKNSGLYNNLGIILDIRKKFNEAIKTLTIAYKLNPYSSDICNNLGIAYKHNKDIDNAIKYYKKGLKLDSKSFQIWFNLGVSLMVKGNFKDSENAFKKALSLEKNVVVIYKNLESVLQLQGKNKEALMVSIKGSNIKNDD